MTTPSTLFMPSAKSSRAKVLLLILLIAAFLPILFGYITNNHEFDDWNHSLRPAALAMLHGHSPYGAGFYNPPWGLLPFIPFAAMPPSWGRFTLFLVSFCGFAYLARQLSAKPASILLFLTSFPVIACLDSGNIDWLPMLGFVAPAPLALILAVIKPQIGIGIAVYWLFESWRQGGARRIVLNFLPVSLLLGSSFLFYGLWPLAVPDLSAVSWNIALFPYTVPVGIFVLCTAILRREARPSMSAGILLSPYYSWMTLSSLLVALLHRPRFLAVAWIATWAAFIALTVLR